MHKIQVKSLANLVKVCITLDLNHSVLITTITTNFVAVRLPSVDLVDLGVIPCAVRVFPNRVYPKLFWYRYGVPT